mgnify:FL=1
MYRKSPQGWLKHWDFILLDIISLQAAFIIAYFSRIELGNPYGDYLYRSEAFVFVLCQIAVFFFCQPYQGIIKRGYYAELTKTVKHVILVMLLAMTYLFVTQQSALYSRMAFFTTAALYLFIDYLCRIIRKWRIVNKNDIEGKRAMVLVASSSDVKETLRRLLSESVQEFFVTGIVLLDTDLTGDSIEGIPVVGNVNNVKDYLCHEWVDEVFVKLSESEVYPSRLIDDLVMMGLTVHLSLDAVERPMGGKKHVERIGEYTVVTSSINMASPKQMLYKRLMDLAGGFVGCIITLLLIFIIGPMIYLKSPGPIFFSQVRIGQNGKKFKIYKFRSMYMDAEERKAELMKNNKMNGLMFKMDYDPRIIGSEKRGKDGKPKGIGNFIRKTSLDEFPQFWNVLKGDMSLVGTRPPTVDEWEKYELHHRIRMATKPGITGMWQVSGRSDITDFEEVVRLDTEYIEHWSIGLDIKILLKTVLAVLKNDGAV